MLPLSPHLKFTRSIIVQNKIPLGSQIRAHRPVSGSQISISMFTREGGEGSWIPPLPLRGPEATTRDHGDEEVGRAEDPLWQRTRVQHSISTNTTGSRFTFSSLYLSLVNMLFHSDEIPPRNVFHSFPPTFHKMLHKQLPPLLFSPMYFSAPSILSQPMPLDPRPTSHSLRLLAQ